jgi:acetyl-CoA acetyltransferase
MGRNSQPLLDETRSPGNPVFAVPKLLERTGVKLEDIGVWELNEAFAVQTIYCRDRLGIDNGIFNINGGAISIGHPHGMTG